MRTRTRVTWSAIAASALIGLSVLVWYRLSLARQSVSAARPLPLVQVAKPSLADMERKLLLTADVLPIQQADLRAKVAGYLDRIDVDRGDRVRRGQTLAVIRQPELERQRQRAQATYDLAKVTYERLQQLFDRKLVAKQDLDDARTKCEVAKHDLELQQSLMQYAKIVAPFDGWVTRRYVDPGALIAEATNTGSATNTVVTVMDVSQVKVLINVPERDIASVRLGDEVSLAVDAYQDQSFHGRVSRFAPALDPGSRTLQVEIDIPNRDLILKPGMFARVTLVLERHAQALTVPAETLLVNEMGSFLYVVGVLQDGTPTVRRAAVRTGIEDGGRVEILVGLGASDQIVRAGKEQVRDGSRVRVAEDGAQPARGGEH